MFLAPDPSPPAAPGPLPQGERWAEGLARASVSVAAAAAEEDPPLPSRERSAAQRPGEGEVDTATAGATFPVERSYLDRETAAATSTHVWPAASEINQVGRNLAAVNKERPQRHRKFEPSRPGTPRVDEEHALANLVQGPVRMAEGNRMEPRRGGVEVELGDVVDHINEGRADLEHRGFGNG